MKKGVLRNFSKFTGKYLFQSFFYNKAAGLRPWHRWFLVNFEKFLRTPFLQNTSGRLFLPQEINHWTFLPSNKDFYEVKHLHEVAYTAPCLIFFRNLFKISKLECVNSPFFRTPSINYSEVIFQGKIPLSLVLRGISQGEGGSGSCQGLVVQRGIIQEKMFRVKSPGGNCPRGSFMGVNCPGCNWQLSRRETIQG